MVNEKAFKDVNLNGCHNVEKLWVIGNGCGHGFILDFGQRRMRERWSGFSPFSCGYGQIAIQIPHIVAEVLWSQTILLNSTREWGM